MQIPLTEMLEGTYWGRNLTPSEMQRVLACCLERSVSARESIVRPGEPAEYWVGLISGYGHMSVGHANGRETSLIGVAAGAWFGEGTLIKRGHWQYEAVALRDCRLALMPRSCFEWLRERSIPFNHYLQHLMSARMGHFIAQLSQDRLLDFTERVARSLASLYSPDLYPEPGPYLDLLQTELGQLAGVSRQRANIALQTLEEAGLIARERRGLRVLDLPGLRRYMTPA